jgi:hypothetical protein
MRLVRTLVATAAAMLMAGAVDAQNDPPLSVLQTSVACAPPPSFTGPPAGAPRIIGAQDTVPRRLFGEHDLLVIDAGTASGLQLGQQFFVRRENRFGKPSGQHSRGVRTLGWLRVVALNETTAIAAVQHVCGGIIQHDYLEPFTAPVVPAGAERDDASGEPDFTKLARFVAANEDRQTAGAGDFMLIDRGAEQGMAPGTRVAVYRDTRSPHMPLASVGEAVVVSVGPTAALTRITRARDAVLSGDYVAIRR